MRGYDDEAGEGPQPVGAYERHQTVQDRWDCESVLSLRSNLDNHPASITEPHSSRRARRQVLSVATIREPNRTDRFKGSFKRVV
jgi:hypothetical protein